MGKRALSSRAIADRIVTHVTEVSISLVPDEEPVKGDALSPAAVRVAGARLAEHYARVATMMELLGRHGFVSRAGKAAVVCTSTEMEAGETKRLLLGAGFADREFQIVLEYTRGWGML